MPKTTDSLQNRHQLIKKIRHYLDGYGLIEVQTSTLLPQPISDVYIDSIALKVNGNTDFYLHTSPELEMKKIIAAGCGNIYQICQVFRDFEAGERNFNEFTLLEYYRQGFDIHRLMADIMLLLQVLGVEAAVQKFSYQEVFSQFVGVEVLKTEFSELQKIAKDAGISYDFEFIEDLQILLFTHFVEPNLAEFPACFIYDYPPNQAALARVENGVALRFELYMKGVEIANGYDEVQKVDEYRQRFSTEIDKRQILGKPSVKLDEDFLAKIDQNLPQCSGVAIGIERLLSQIS